MDHSPPGFSVHGNFPGKNTGMGCHTLFQGIYPTPGIKPASLAFLVLAGKFFTTSATWKAPSLYPLEFIYCLNMFSLVLLSFKNYFNF